MAANDAQIPSVEDIQRDPAAVLARLRDENSFAYSFGDDGSPEAVLLTYDEYEDLSGPQKFTATDEVLTPDAIQRQLPAIIAAIRNGSFTQPILWSDTTEPEAVIMSPQRHLRTNGRPPIVAPRNQPDLQYIADIPRDSACANTQACLR